MVNDACLGISKQTNVLSSGRFVNFVLQDNKVLLRYNKAQDEWQKCGLTYIEMYGMQAVYLDEKIIVIGSPYVINPSTNIKNFDLQTKIWKPLPEMRIKRFMACLVVFDRKIYAIGGYGGDSNFQNIKSVEM